MQLSLVFTILVAFTAFTLASPIPQLGFYELSAEHGELESKLIKGYEVDSVGGSNYAHEREVSGYNYDIEDESC